MCTCKSSQVWRSTGIMVGERERVANDSEKRTLKGRRCHSRMNVRVCLPAQRRTLYRTQEALCIWTLRTQTYRMRSTAVNKWVQMRIQIDAASGRREDNHKPHERARAAFDFFWGPDASNICDDTVLIPNQTGRGSPKEKIQKKQKALLKLEFGPDVKPQAADAITGVALL